MTHKYKEGFCLMQYESADGQTRETIWNSRNGVTPFAVVSIDGVHMQHVDWHEDKFAPYHVPSVGSRIFVDLTPENAHQQAVAYVEKYWDWDGGAKMKDHYSDKETAIQGFVEIWTADKGSPTIIEVTEELHEFYKTNKRDIPQGMIKVRFA